MFKSSVFWDRVASNVTRGSNVPAVSDSSATKAGGESQEKVTLLRNLCSMLFVVYNVLEEHILKGASPPDSLTWKSYL